MTLEHACRDYDCAFADDGIPVGTLVCGVPVVGKTDELDRLFTTYRNLVVTIGNNKLRERLYENAAKIGYSFPNIVCPSAYISPFAKVGQGCIILNNAVVQNGSTVGNGVILNPGVEVHHDSAVEDYALIYTNSVIRSLARVCRRAWVGSTLTISNEVTIPEDAIVENGNSMK